jgi:hypothetical protein
MIDTTYALMHGKINSVNDIIDAVEQEQEHDERFHSCRVLIREVKRLRKTLACIAFSPDEPEWVMSKIEELEVDSETWQRWHE